jgi:hypothetical protein
MTTTPNAVNSTITGAHMDGVDPHAVTISGLVLDASYGPSAPPASLTNFDRDIQEPGSFPYTRGFYPEGYRSASVDHAAVRGLRLG